MKEGRRPACVCVCELTSRLILFQTPLQMLQLTNEHAAAEHIKARQGIRCSEVVSNFPEERPHISSKSSPIKMCVCVCVCERKREEGRDAALSCAAIKGQTDRWDRLRKDAMRSAP